MSVLSATDIKLIDEFKKSIHDKRRLTFLLFLLLLLMVMMMLLLLLVFTSLNIKNVTITAKFLLAHDSKVVPFKNRADTTD